ncbi:MAG: nuclear transport factor 2 family protein [Acidobacteria bacterium]|nr:MAG: nuclear transport factor 2 family protein [Acidobacteriota bacterium]
MKRRRFLVAALALCGLPAVFGATPDQQAVEQAERNWAKAVLAGDIAALQTIFADDLIYTHSTGAVDDKTSYLAKMNSGTKYEAIDYQSMTVHIYGKDAAIVHSKARLKATTPTGGVDSNLMMLHVWAKQGKTWKMVAHQTTRLP